MKHHSFITGLGRFSAIATVFVLCAISFAAQTHTHVFTFKTDADAKTVSVMGSFNNWNPALTPMKKGPNNLWQVPVELPEGVYHYKFVVNQTQFFLDPNSDPQLNEGDGFGGLNSGVAIGAAAQKVEPAAFQHANAAQMPHAIPGNDVLLPTGKYEHKFVFTPGKFVSGKIKSVSVAGSFNNWSKQANLLQHRGNGVWEVSLPLEKGVHLYKFVVNNNRWLNDPASDKDFEQDDCHEGVNSAVYVGPDGRDLPKAKTSYVNMDVLKVESINVYQKNKAIIQLRTQAKDATEIILHYAASNTNDWQTVPMNLTDRSLASISMVLSLYVMHQPSNTILKLETITSLAFLLPKALVIPSQPPHNTHSPVPWLSSLIRPIGLKTPSGIKFFQSASAMATRPMIQTKQNGGPLSGSLFCPAKKVRSKTTSTQVPATSGGANMAATSKVFNRPSHTSANLASTPSISTPSLKLSLCTSTMPPTTVTSTITLASKVISQNSKANHSTPQLGNGVSPTKSSSLLSKKLTSKVSKSSSMASSITSAPNTLPSRTSLKITKIDLRQLV